MLGRICFCVSFVILVPWLNACAISHRYATDDVATIHPLAGQRMVVPALMDARDNGRPVSGEAATESASEEMEELRASVGEHVSRAGVEALTAPAPQSAEDVAALLARARDAGVREVMFIRYHGSGFGVVCASTASLVFLAVVPYLVIQTLPLSRQAAIAGFEAFVVDPVTGEVVAGASRFIAGHDHVNQWRCHRDNLVHDVLRTAVDDVLGDIAAQRADDYPHRFRPIDVASFVAGAPEVRVQGGRVHGLGWSHPLPAGWTFDPSIGVHGGARGPGGTELVADVGYCIGGTRRCATIYQRELRRAGEEIVERVDIEDRGLPAAQIESRRPDGTRVLLGVVGDEGVTVQLRCAAPPGAPEHELGACQQAFAGATWHVSHVQR